MALDAYYYGDPAEVLDRIRAERRREAEKEAVRRKKKRRRIRNFMKKLRLK
jgi:hypothetical protein